MEYTMSRERVLSSHIVSSMINSMRNRKGLFKYNVKVKLLLDAENGHERNFIANIKNCGIIKSTNIIEDCIKQLELTSDDYIIKLYGLYLYKAD